MALLDCLSCPRSKTVQPPRGSEHDVALLGCVPIGGIRAGLAALRTGIKVDFAGWRC